MSDPVLDKKRLDLVDAYRNAVWQLALARPEAIEDIVAILGGDEDANANELFGALGVPVTPGERGDGSLVVVPREAAVTAIEQYAPNLARSLRTSTPMHLTVLILAFGGGTVARMAHNVGFA